MPYTNKQANLDMFRTFIKPYAEKVGLKVVRVKGGWDIRKDKEVLATYNFYSVEPVSAFIHGYQQGLRVG